MISNGVPEATDDLQRSTTMATDFGEWAFCQSEPEAGLGDEPVYSYQRRLNQVISPVASALHARLGMVSARARKRSSLCWRALALWSRSTATETYPAIVLTNASSRNCMRADLILNLRFL